MRRLAAFLLALSLAHLAHAQPVSPPTAAAAKPAVKQPASPKGVSASRSATPSPSGPYIGVIPLIGDRFAVKKIGITVFGNEYKEIPIDNWGLDDLVVERVRAAVGPGIVVRRIAHAKGTFDSYNPGFGLFHNNDGKSAAMVQQVAGQMQCGRYVVVTRAASLVTGNQGINGVGVVNVGGPLLNKSFVHALVHVNIHDGRSFAVLKREAGSISGNDSRIGPSTRKLDDFMWPDSPEAANTPAMRGTTRALLAEVLDKRLPALLAP
jgi:hypothetical protein